jgi:RNA polymerase sigma factor (sigma-70 family)
MEGNDRVAVNIRKGTEKKVFSYESIGEGWAKLQDRKDGMLQKLDEIAIREYLTDQQYKVFIGAVMYGLSQQQIAEEMGISRSAVKKHYDLALRKIRKADMV